MKEIGLNQNLLRTQEDTKTKTWLWKKDRIKLSCKGSP